MHRQTQILKTIQVSPVSQTRAKHSMGQNTFNAHAVPDTN